MTTFAGLAFNKRTMSESDFFEIDVAFRVMGQGRIGADGIGIWYTAQQPALGPVSSYRSRRLADFFFFSRVEMKVINAAEKQK